MKSLIFFVSLLLAANVYAQDCKGFYYLKNGVVQMTMYDKKSDESGKVTYTISGVSTSGNTTTANFTSEAVNEKGKSMSKASGSYKCTGGAFYVDAKAAIPQESMSAYKDMDVKADQVYIEYPSTLEPGQSLRDVNFKMDIYNKGSLFATLTFDEVNRKVTTKESITTPAGTWECWKITNDVRLKAAAAPLNIGVPVNMQVTEWFAPGFGIVKTETYNKSGKLMGSTQIKSVKQ